ncbi:uncharacterized protein [Nicotiana tomentosiformis]|uniref:uncharacterized protein n=1 Tax=Nicotiana tomentosiformis TaxID=4098 RepID=UPI00051B1FC2|nr:uncharacterized protein LOC104116419 [Nicotiana tomentosiformis]
MAEPVLAKGGRLWWNFRTTKTLWANFMWNKYCKKELPTTVQFREGSHVWRKMLEAREEIEHEILWELNRGTTNIWHENWTGLGALYHAVPSDFDTNENLQEVIELREGYDWNYQMLENNFPAEIAAYISQELHFENTYEGCDTLKWMPTASGRFSVTTAWQLMRHRAHPKHEYKLLRTKGLPFKISFFLWRLWKGKVPTYDMWRKNGYMVVSKCWCCLQPEADSIQHLFLTSSTANRVWRFFGQAAGSSNSDNLGALEEKKHNEV